MVGETKSVTSKTILPTYGSLHMTVMFSVLEDKGRNKGRIYKSDGQSKFYNNVKIHYKKMIKDTTYNAVKRKFPSGTFTPYNIIILEYHFVYLLHRYNVTEKNGKYYEKYRDVETKRTKYIRIEDGIKNPEVEYY